MCNNPDCRISTGIHERLDANGSQNKPWGLTFGSGELDDYGYWEFPCLDCARYYEALHGMKKGTYWPELDLLVHT